MRSTFSSLRYGGGGGGSFVADTDADMTADFGFSPASGAGLAQRRASRWNDGGMGVDAPTSVPVVDEFRAEFESHHSLAAQARAERARAQQRHEARGGGGSGLGSGIGISAGLLVVGGGYGPVAGLDAPPTSSLSAMLAATPLRSGAGAGSSGAGLASFHSGGGSLRSGGSLSGLSGIHGAPSSPPVDVHRAYGHFREQMGAQHQFAYQEWSASVLHWRTVAAAVWFGLTALLVLQVASMRYTSCAPGWRTLGLGWGWELRLETTLLAHWPAVTAFLGAQVALLLLRAQAAHTDPSPLFQPLALRVWRCATQPRLLLLACSAALAVLVAGWNAAHVLFADSSLWNAAAPAPAPVAAADAVAAAAVASTSVASSNSALVVAGLLCYTLLSSFLLVFQYQTLLQFPPLRFLSRTRLVLAVLPGLFLRATSFALCFCLGFRVAVWSWMQGALAALAHVGSSAEEVAAAAAVVAPSSFFSLSSLPALYHLFLLVLVLDLCALLVQHFLRVFLTQPLDFGPFVLHALYDTRADAGDAVARAVGGASSFSAGRRVAEWRANEAGEMCVGSSGALVPSASPRGTDHLTGHLVLHYLHTLVSNAALVHQRNAVLFSDDMNALVSGAGVPAASGANQSEGIMLQPPQAQGSSSFAAPVPPSIRSTLPHEPAFVPVLLSCLHRVRLLTEALVAQRMLASYAPPADDWHAAAAIQQGGGVVAGSGGNIVTGLGAALSPFNSAPLTTASAAFVSTQLDGGGLLFPSKAQLTAQVFAQARQAEMAVHILAGLAVHAQTETAAAAQASKGAGGNVAPSSAVVAATAAQLSGSWSEPIVSHLLALSLALEQYAHASHFLSPLQDRVLQGHQLTRAVCVQIAASVDNALYRLSRSYFEVLPDFHLAPPYAARLQAYANFAK